LLLFFFLFLLVRDEMEEKASSKINFDGNGDKEERKIVAHLHH
jgi:hypothetical protein